ncbi:hypothetical protein HELRODRAFT_189566 [Helobdella robusta]|uniref:Ion transport domain-containing protein n=1 Tax=Helobdella robusta TaxID=6412 RepID=T1FR58_HELRO|nr:hypothetical protein HELRODRAFT_189566 [Helobdella robusta]ESN92681.1 hypothetical protein HELRODRAFT_189566 [Helobdella robusta]
MDDIRFVIVVKECIDETPDDSAMPKSIIDRISSDGDNKIGDVPYCFMWLRRTRQNEQVYDQYVAMLMAHSAVEPKDVGSSFAETLVEVYQSDEHLFQKIYFVFKQNKSENFQTYLKKIINFLEKKNIEGQPFSYLLNSAIKISKFSDFKTFETKKLLEYFIQERDKLTTSSLLKLGCRSSLQTFISSYDHASTNLLLDLTTPSPKELLAEDIFHHIVLSYRYSPNNYSKLKIIFNRILKLYPAQVLTKLFNTPSARYKNLNVLEYSCYIQAPKMLELILNSEGVLRRTSEKIIGYDVSNFIPETMIDDDVSQEEPADNNKKAQQSDANNNNETTKSGDENPTVLEMTSFLPGSPCPPQPASNSPQPPSTCLLERIIATSADDERRAALLMHVPPMRYVVSNYVLVSQVISALLFLLQVIYMICFTAFVISDAKLSVSQDDSFEARSKKGINRLYRFFIIIPPLLFFIYSLIQANTLNRLIEGADESKKGFKLYKLKNISYYELLLFIGFMSWPALKDDLYFEISVVILVLGWLKPAYYLSYYRYWSAFIVALKSSMTKYLISFAFIFTFVYIGFSMAFRVLLIRRATTPDEEKPMETVAYMTFVTLFGMGELDQMPSEHSTGSILLMKLTVCLYCSSLAILVLAIIRQPDEEVVVRVGSELTPRVNLKFIKEVAWLILLKKHLDDKNKQRHYSRQQQQQNAETIKPYRRPLPGEKYGSAFFQFRKILGLESRVFKEVGNRYHLRLMKDDVIDPSVGSDDDVTSGDDDVRERGKDVEDVGVSGELEKVKSSVERVEKKLEILIERIGKL